MGVLATNNRQLIFIYSEDSRKSNRLLPYIHSMSKPVRLININKECISDTIWVEIAAMLKVELGELFQIFSLDNNDASNTDNFSASDWLKIIDKTPSALKHPIAINGIKAKIIKENHQIFSFFNPTGANFDKDVASVKFANHEDTTGYKNAM